MGKTKANLVRPSVSFLESFKMLLSSFDDAKNSLTKKRDLPRQHIVYFHYFVIFVIVLFAFRFFFTAEALTSGWDFSFPMTFAQTKTQLFQSFDLIDSRVSLGVADPSNSISFYYWVVVIPFSWLFGVHGVKAVIFVFIWGLIVSFYRLLVDRFAIQPWVALYASLLGGLSPFTYSRLVAGHVNVLVGSAFFVLYFFYLIRVFDYKSQKTIKDYFSTTLCLAFLSIHPMLLGMAAVASFTLVLSVLFSLIVYLVLNRQDGFRKINILRFLRPLIAKCGLMIVIALVVNVHWLYTSFSLSFNGFPYFKSDQTVQQLFEEKTLRARSTKNSVQNVVTLFDSQNVSTEYAFPIRYPVLWQGVFIMLLFSALYTVIKRFILTVSTSDLDPNSNDFKLETNKIYDTGLRFLFPVFLLVFGIILTSGVETELGRLIYENVIYKLGPVFFEFSNTSRFSFLIIFASCVLLGIGFSYMRKTLFFHIFFIVAVLIRCLPFFDNSLIKGTFSAGTVPMSMRLVELSSFDFDVLDTINKEYKGRTVFLPPSRHVNIDDSINYESQILRTESADYFSALGYYDPFRSFALSTLYNEKRDDDVARLFALADVKDIFLIKYPNYVYTDSFGLFTQEDTPKDESSINLNFEAFFSASEYFDQVASTEHILHFKNMHFGDTFVGSDNLILTDKGYVRAESLETFGFISYIENFNMDDKTHLTQMDSVNPNKFILWSYPRFASGKPVRDNGWEPQELRGELYKNTDVLSLPLKDKGLVLREGSYSLDAANDYLLVELVSLDFETTFVVNNQPICFACNGVYLVDISNTPKQIVMDVWGGSVGLVNANTYSKKGYEELIDVYANLANTTSGITEVGNIYRPKVTKKSPTHFVVEFDSSPSYIYFSTKYDVGWDLVNVSNEAKIYSGAGGMVFALDDNKETVFEVKYLPQTYLSTGYTLLGGFWVLFTITVTLRIILGYKNQDSLN